jgi:hypothetical protein
MIPVWNESSSTMNEFPTIIERCVFCQKKTRTWHENTNNPVCVSCAKIKKVSDIPEDHGVNTRKRKRLGTFDREDSTRAN